MLLMFQLPSFVISILKRRNAPRFGPIIETTLRSRTKTLAGTGRTRKNDYASIPVRWKSSVIQKVLIMCEQDTILLPGIRKYVFIRMSAEPNIRNEDGIPAVISKNASNSFSEAFVDQESSFLLESTKVPRLLICDRREFLPGHVGHQSDHG
jgi:hypothetical protein